MRRRRASMVLGRAQSQHNGQREGRLHRGRRTLNQAHAVNQIRDFRLQPSNNVVVSSEITISSAHCSGMRVHSSTVVVWGRRLTSYEMDVGRRRGHLDVMPCAPSGSSTMCPRLPASAGVHKIAAFLHIEFLDTRSYPLHTENTRRTEDV